MLIWVTWHYVMQSSDIPNADQIVVVKSKVLSRVDYIQVKRDKRAMEYL